MIGVCVYAEQEKAGLINIMNNINTHTHTHMVSEDETTGKYLHHTKSLMKGQKQHQQSQF